MSASDEPRDAIITSMNDGGDIHATARGYFLAKVANGQLPSAVSGGKYDGLLHFPIRIDGVEYWLTEGGLFTPPGAMLGPPCIHLDEEP